MGAVGVIGYLMFFQSTPARRRRRLLSTAKSDYQTKVREIRAKYPRRRLGLA